MNAGKELDAQIELLLHGPWDEKRCRICNWPLKDRLEDGCVPDSCALRPAPEVRADEPAAYSTTLSLAMLVAFEMHKRGYEFEIFVGHVSPGAFCKFSLSALDSASYYERETPDRDKALALAICNAALKVSGVEVRSS